MSEEQIKALQDELSQVKNALMASEGARRMYEECKFKMYAHPEEAFREFAVDNFPCGMGPLDRFTNKIEREHSPKLYKQVYYFGQFLKEKGLKEEYDEWVEKNPPPVW